MKINQDFTIQKVGDSYVAVAVGESSKGFHGMIRLNETGAFLWGKMSERDCTEEELVEALLGEYDIDRETATSDVHRMVENLKKYPVFA